MKYLFILLLLISSTAFSQTTYYIRADSTKLQKVGSNNELILQNSTRTRTGAYLKNISNGITGFFYAVDSAYISGSNLVLVRGGGTQNITVPAGVGGYNSNVGSGYRWAIPNTNNIKTLLAGTNITIDSSVANTLTINAAASTNIYNSDGTLTGERVVSQGGSLLNFLNGGVVIAKGTSTTNQSVFQLNQDYVKMRGGITDGSGVEAWYDSVRLTPRLGVLKIDTLTFVPGTKALRYNPSTGLVSYADTSTAAGGGTPAGNFGNLQINRNGAFATPGSDSLDFESATGLTVKGNITSSTLTNGRVLIGGASGLIRDYAALTFDGSNLLNTTTGGVGTGYTVTATNANSYASMNFITDVGGNGFQIGKYGSTGTVPNGVFFYNPDNSPTVFTQNNNRIMDITGAGNLLLGGTADPASAYYTIGLFNGGAPTGSITNGVIIYSEDVAASAELKVRDEAGNITVLSPHHFEGIPMGKSEDMAWSYYSERDGKYITVDMLKAIRTIEDLTRRVEKLEKELNMKSKKPVKLVYTGKVKAKKPVPINKQP